MSTLTIKRLQQDLKQLEQEPIVGAMACPFDGKNLMIWFGIVVGSEGSPLSGIPIRFYIEFPNDYPNSSPKAYFETFIRYANGLQFYDKKGRIEVCLYIFENFRYFHTERGSHPFGWSPTYTVSTILLSMQSMIMQGILSKKTEDVEKMIKSALDFKCRETGHVGSDSTKWFPQVILDPDIAQVIRGKYQDKNILSKEILQKFFVCYVNRAFNACNSLIGYGVHVEDRRKGIVTSPCEYLSNTSFFRERIRSSTENQPFEFWIPILVEKEDWALKKRVKKKFLRSVELICSRINYTGEIHEKVFKVCSSLMNSAVLEILNNKKKSKANEKFINGYFSIFRLLYNYSQSDKSLVSFSNDSLKKFVISEDSRDRYFSSLGEFLIHLTISTEFQFEDLSQLFMYECDARIFFCYYGGRSFPTNQCDDKYLINSLENEKIFHATRDSRNLMAFQTKFVNATKFLDLEKFSSNFGIAPESIVSELKSLYPMVVALKNWNEFFQFVDIPQLDENHRKRNIVNIVKRSAGHVVRLIHNVCNLQRFE